MEMPRKKKKGTFKATMFYGRVTLVHQHVHASDRELVSDWCNRLSTAPTMDMAPCGAGSAGGWAGDGDDWILGCQCGFLGDLDNIIVW